MTEWAVVGVLITLFGFGVAIVTPIVKLNTTITTINSTIASLTDIVKKCETDLSLLQERNADTHQRIFERIENHETRITVLEHDIKGD